MSKTLWDKCLANTMGNSADTVHHDQHRDIVITINTDVDNDDDQSDYTIIYIYIMIL